MRREVTIKTRSLAGTSDLTLLAPIKPGLVPSLESLTYKTRAKRLLRALTSLRAASHESALLRPFSDAVERVGRIHSVRVAVIEPEDKILLAVTFDGDWESYIRVLWQKVGGLLDVVFCNTVDYVSACDHSFAEWLVWAKRIQTESAFFYAAPHTVDDVPNLRREELLQRMTDEAVQALYAAGLKTDTDTQSADRELLATRSSFRGAEAEAAAQRNEDTASEAFKQGFLALSGLYRLADLFLPEAPDGKHLQRASRELLVEFRAMIDAGLPPPLAERFARQLQWLNGGDPPVRPVPPLEEPKYDSKIVQGGIVTAYERTTHGCLMLMAFDDAAAGARFLDGILPHVSHDGAQPTQEGTIATNIAITFEGFRALGLSDAQLDWFAQEFREGMEARAGLLGDLRTNHPRRWRLPSRVDANLANVSGTSVELSTVHVILQLRVNASDAAGDDLSRPEHPLHKRIKEILKFEPAARLLALQSMRRHMEIDPNTKTEKIREHFGFFDGGGQPLIGPQTGASHYPNGVHLGEVLLGHSNEADPTPIRVPPTDPAYERQAVLFDGSYLVIRKLRQDVPALHAKATQAADANGMKVKDVLAKMVGRNVDGSSIVQPVGKDDNDFNYGKDATGSQCPFHSHIRRANPRTQPDPKLPLPFGARTPRIMRRGMSYGPRYDSKIPDSALAERGLMFMAYNASIGEQFEVVQRWLAGGNSTGGLSFDSDPLLGVPENGKQRFYRFENQGKVVRMELDGSPKLLADPQPFVRLEWGIYSFAPSLRALRKLKDIATASASHGTAPVWSVDDGVRQLAALRQLEAAGDDQATIAAWKSALEDPDAQERFASASLWAAIRDRHHGALRTPYGVLVADRTLAMQVLRDTSGRYTANGYLQRMSTSIGSIYLGLDRPAPGCQYDIESAATNGALQKLDERVEFDRTLAITRGVLAAIFAKANAEAQGTPYWAIPLDIKEVSDRVLATLCQYWFGLPKDEPNEWFEVGASRWDWKSGEKPLYPGNVTAPSRYIFQPRPNDTVEQYGNLYGRTFTARMEKFIEPYCREHRVPKAPDGKPAPITAAILEAHWNGVSSVTQVAQNIVGAMMGFLPTVDGNLRRSLNEWLVDQTFWRLRGRLSTATGDAYEKADSLLRGPLMRTMQLRPSPELIWRTAVRRHDLGPVAVETDDLIVVSIVSATQQCLQHGITEVFPIFGGERSKPDHHPTHACPAYAAAMGVLLGMVDALLEMTQLVRPGPAPVTLTVSGPVTPVTHSS
jgi:Dyp-type peroxidase family